MSLSRPLARLALSSCIGLAACSSNGSSTSSQDEPDASKGHDAGADVAPDATPASHDGGSDTSTPGHDDGSAGDSSTTTAADSSTGGDAGDSSTTTPDAGPLGPIDLTTATIYSVYTSIYSQAGSLDAVTADLGRIRGLGFNVLYLLPVTPIGQATGSHPSYGSPYCVHDYYAIDPSLGTSADLVALVNAAHALGMYVILDEVLNHTSWDNALITEHPEYYVHSDGNPQNPASIEQAFTFADVAQLDYKTPTNGLATYMTTMLSTLVTTYGVDGFRFDTADNPYGSGRMITQTFWQAMATQLATVKPGLLLLGEEEDPQLDEAPFTLDYGWDLQGLYGSGGLQQVASGGSATMLQTAWTSQVTGYPTGTHHMTLMQDWDLDEDLTLYGGVPNTMAAATFAFTIDGVPMLFNGEEVGNDNSAVNTHTVIDWASPNAGTFQPFYESLLKLRNGTAALQDGTVDWIQNSASGSVATFTRSDANGTVLVAINFSGGTVSGTLSAPSASGWADVSPVGSPGGTHHASPPDFSLSGYDFEVLQAK